jgi:hypothetical protein
MQTPHRCNCDKDPGFDFNPSTPCSVCGKCLRCGDTKFPHDCLHNGAKGHTGETGYVEPKAQHNKLQPIVGKVRNKARHRREAERVAKVIAISGDLSKIKGVHRIDENHVSIPFFPLRQQPE